MDPVPNAFGRSFFGRDRNALVGIHYCLQFPVSRISIGSYRSRGGQYWPSRPVPRFSTPNHRPRPFLRVRSFGLVCRGFSRKHSGCLEGTDSTITRTLPLASPPRPERVREFTVSKKLSSTSTNSFSPLVPLTHRGPELVQHIPNRLIIPKAFGTQLLL